MKVNNVKIYDFEESIVASGLPMMAEYSEAWTVNEIINLRNCEDVTKNPHFKRACKLADNPAGSGHNNFLSGILVSMDVTASQVWWQQFQRYHFVQIVSSMSKMHRLRQIAAKGKYPFAPGTDEDAVCLMHCLMEDEDIGDVALAYACPMGLELTARVTTNFLQLKTIYQQRKAHKLPEWVQFCEFIKALPFSKEFIIGKEN